MIDHNDHLTECELCVVIQDLTNILYNECNTSTSIEFGKHFRQMYDFHCEEMNKPNNVNIQYTKEMWDYIREGIESYLYCRIYYAEGGIPPQNMGVEGGITPFNVCDLEDPALTYYNNECPFGYVIEEITL